MTLLTLVSLLNSTVFNSNESSFNTIENQMHTIITNLENPANVAAEILKIPSVAIIEREKKIGFQTQEEEYIFKQTIQVINGNVEFLKSLVRKYRLNYLSQFVSQPSFQTAYNIFIVIYCNYFSKKIEMSDEDSVTLNKIYFSILQDFFIFYIKGSGALYLLFTSNENHKQFVASAISNKDLLNLAEETECLVNKQNKETNQNEKKTLLDTFNSLNLGNSDWDLNLCINPGIYEKYYEQFRNVYSYLLFWNRRLLCLCREHYFLNTFQYTNVSKYS
jgi:hypothetical protein